MGCQQQPKALSQPTPYPHASTRSPVPQRGWWWLFSQNPDRVPQMTINKPACQVHHTSPAATQRGNGTQVLPRKEVIQPHLPVRLPCYDFVPIASPTFDHSPRKPG
jgi:hypothetical protein